MKTELIIVAVIILILYFSFVKKKDSSSNQASRFNASNYESELISFLTGNNVRWIDNRRKSGALWIVGGRELQPIADMCNLMFGTRFTYKADGAQCAGRKPAWWCSSRTKTKNYSQADLKSMRETISNSRDQEMVKSIFFDCDTLSLPFAQTIYDAIQLNRFIGKTEALITISNLGKDIIRETGASANSTLDYVCVCLIENSVIDYSEKKVLMSYFKRLMKM